MPHTDSPAFAAPAPLASHDERLANGCQLQLLHLPQATHTALWLRVAAGSHDAPSAWPGLAHFLEHMLFLGGAGYAGEQRLMPFVQACGGRLNASTGARATDFFFEVPNDRLEPAAERLLDMLLSPVLDPAAQLAERQVLQAEYLARAADAEQRGAAALQQALAAGHPCTGFHAGDADSLRADLPPFRAALADFHRQYYRAGRCRLLLVGGQPLARLQGLGRRLGAALPVGDGPSTGALPVMLPLQARHWQLQGRAWRAWLGLVCQRQAALPSGTLALLGEALASPQPGGWLGLLRTRGLATELQLQPLYEHAGQALLALRCDGAGGDLAQLRASLIGWLRAFAAAAPWNELQARHAEERRWREAALRPLELARTWLERPAASAWAALPDLLAGLDEASLISLEETSAAPALRRACGFELALAAVELATAEPPELPPGWPGNPLLCTPLPEPRASTLPWVERAGERACLFLRGTSSRDLSTLKWAAEQLGMSLSDGPEGLRLQGWAAHLPALLAALWSAAPAGPEQHAGEMPIRQLLRQLPQQLAPASAPAGIQALLVGPPGLAERLPGLDGARASHGAPPALGASRHWRRLPGTDGNAALLLFCPVPPAWQAAVRWLGLWLAPAFHQRLRGELQLGYALFAGFRQVQGRAGLLFAVQSPRAGVEELLTAVEAFLRSQLRRLEDLDESTFDESRAALARALEPASRPLEDFAEDCWQACLAGLPAEHPQTLSQAVERLDGAALRTCLSEILDARHGWLLLAGA